MKDAKFFTAGDRAAGRTARLQPHALVVRACMHNVAAAVARVPAARRSGRRTKPAARSDSPLVTIDPVARRTYEHLEYKPLVNARAHSLGKRRQIVNDRFCEQYHRFLKELSYRRQLDRRRPAGGDLLPAAAGPRRRSAGDVRPRRTPTKLADADAVRLLRGLSRLLHRRHRRGRERSPTKYADHPVDRWRNAFAAIVAQLDEARRQGADDDRRRRPRPAANAARRDRAELRLPRRSEADRARLPEPRRGARSTTT